MKMRIAVSTVVAALAGAAPAAAQQPALGDQCYRFDRPYFHWFYRGAPGAGVQADSGDTVLLQASAHEGLAISRPEGVLRVRPTSLDPQRQLAAKWLEFSYWQPVPPDTIRLAWREGFYGPVFRLHAAGDTLRGTVTQTTDVWVEGQERPRPGAALAWRVPCPAP